MASGFNIMMRAPGRFAMLDASHAGLRHNMKKALIVAGSASGNMPCDTRETGNNWTKMAQFGQLPSLD
jgi:hypothetical protein